MSNEPKHHKEIHNAKLAAQADTYALCAKEVREVVALAGISGKDAEWLEGAAKRWLEFEHRARARIRRTAKV